VTAILRLTMFEAVRRRLVWALIGLTVVTVGVTAWGFERLVTIAREADVPPLQVAIGLSQTLILTAFMFSFVLAMTAAFMAAPAIGAEIESGVAPAMLARPIRRAEYLLGKWLGLSLLIASYAIVAGLVELSVVAWLTGYSPPEPLGAVVYLAFEAIVLLTLALAIGTRLPAIAAGAIVVVAYGLTWVVGVMGGVGAFFRVPVLVDAAVVARLLVPLDGLWRGVVWSLEPPVIVAIAAGDPQIAGANPFFASAPPSPAYVAWAILWTVAVLGLATILFQRREL